MKRILLFIFVCSLCFGNGYAGELFISTHPINAEVFIDEETVGWTPVRLLNIDKESMDLRIRKDGYAPIHSKIELKSGRTNQLFYTLSPLYLNIVLNQPGKDVYINNIKVGETPLILSNLQNGAYKIENIENDIFIKNARYYELQRVTIVEILFSAALFGVSLSGVFSQEDSTVQTFEYLSLGFGGLLGYNLLKLLKLRTQMKGEAASLGTVGVETFYTQSDKDIFLSGMELLGRELWDDAIMKFNLVNSLYPDSKYRALSTYEIGYCSYKKGDYSRAFQYLREFVFNYPVYELFPFGIYYLIDSGLKQDQGGKVLADYSALRPIFLEDESGQLYKDYYTILVALFQATEGQELFILEDLLAELDYFLETYGESKAYPDIYFLKGMLIYNYFDREKGRSLLKELKEKHELDKNTLLQIERIIND